ncbi:MAG: hypothetical protein IJW73_07560, partial [Candidatus Gastranaerophilales bacterium]|nr:hypothetical protein [Candidatus Gastranaerophilales bacterium]
MSIYGYSILNPFNIDWIKNWGSDQEFHYIGWLFFKNAPFNFPLGMFNTLSYPNEISTLFADSIPIIAITCKAIIKIFNIQGEIQYVGLYGLLCFMLQSFFGMIIGKKITKSNFIALLIGGLFTFQPILFNKMFLHTALCSHYLILASILCVLYYKELSEKKYLKYIAWSIISL